MRGYKLENCREIPVSESLLQNETAQASRIPWTRSTVLGQLVTFLERAYWPHSRMEWPVRFGDEPDLCSKCSKIPLTTHVHDSYNPTWGRVRLSVGLAIAREASLGVLEDVETRSRGDKNSKPCALCGVVLSVLLKDLSVNSKVSSNEECILRPGLGAFRTYMDSDPVADVFYGNRPGNPVRRYIQFSHIRHVPTTLWKMAAESSAPEGGTPEEAAARICDKIIRQQKSTDRQDLTTEMDSS